MDERPRAGGEWWDRGLQMGAPPGDLQVQGASQGTPCSPRAMSPALMVPSAHWLGVSPWRAQV